jgi:hypothetical protein
MRNVVCIDLTIFSSKEYFEKFMKSVNLDFTSTEWFIDPFDENMNVVDCLWNWKESGYRKIWLDRLTLDFIASEDSKGNRNFTENYMNFMANIVPLKPGDLPPTERKPFIGEFNVKSIYLDDVLDKISRSGLESLTKRELDFLANIKF